MGTCSEEKTWEVTIFEVDPLSSMQGSIHIGISPVSPPREGSVSRRNFISKLISL